MTGVAASTVLAPIQMLQTSDTGKRMSISRTGLYGGGEVDLDAYWSYDTDGKVTQVRYGW